MPEELTAFRAALADLVSSPQPEIGGVLEQTTKVLKLASVAAEKSNDDGAAIYTEVVKALRKRAASDDPEAMALFTDLAQFWDQVATTRAVSEVVVEPMPAPDPAVTQTPTAPLLSSQVQSSRKPDPESSSQSTRSFESKFNRRRSPRDQSSTGPAKNPGSTDASPPRGRSQGPS